MPQITDPWYREENKEVIAVNHFKLNIEIMINIRNQTAKIIWLQQKAWHNNQNHEKWLRTQWLSQVTSLLAAAFCIAMSSSSEDDFGTAAPLRGMVVRTSGFNACLTSLYVA